MSEESNRMAEDGVKHNIALLFAGPPEIMVGEVVAHKVAYSQDGPLLRGSTFRG